MSKVNRVLQALGATCRPAAVLLAACVALGPATVALAQAGARPPPPADASTEASERYRRGVTLYKKGEYEAALVEFKKAYEVLPNWSVLYNLGQTSRELKDYASALTAYERYLADGGKEVPAARVKEVKAALEELRPLVGALDVSSNVEGAEVLVDDVSVGFTPLTAPVIVNVGKHTVSASKSKYAPFRRAVEVGGKETLAVSLELELIEVPLPDPTPPSTPPPPEPGPPIAAIVAAGVTGASAIVTGVLGGLALSAQSDLDAELAAFPGDAAAIDDAQARTRTMAIGADVMLGVTIAGAGTSALLFILAFTGDASPDAPSDDDEPTEEPEVTLLPGPLGGALRVRF